VNYDAWMRLSGGTGLVSDGASNIDAIEGSKNDRGINDGVRAVVQATEKPEDAAAELPCGPQVM
jgi:hypothetical protein